MRQISLFLLAGGLAATANVGSRILYSMVMSLAASVIAAYLTGMVVAFALFRRFVFEDAGNHTAVRFWRFTVVNVLALLQTLAVTLSGTWFLRSKGVDDGAEFLAHSVGVAIPVFTSYLLHKRWTFAERKVRPP